MSGKYLRCNIDAESFTWTPKVCPPPLPTQPFYHCECTCKEGAEQRLQRQEIIFLFLVSSIFSFPTIHPFLCMSPVGVCESFLSELHFVQQTAFWDYINAHQLGMYRQGQITAVHCGCGGASCIRG